MTVNHEQGVLASGGTPRETPRCANCGADIPWAPAMHRGETYCCGGCAQGGPCYCSYDLTTFDWLFPATRRELPAPPPPGMTTPATPAPGAMPRQAGKRGPGWS